MFLENGKQNRLLWALMVISIGVHLILLLKIAGWYRFSTPVTIELDLRSISPPADREILRPRPAPATKVRPQEVDRLKIPDEITAGEQAPSIEPWKRLTADNLAEPMQLPELPEIENIDIAAWKETKEERSPEINDTIEPEEDRQKEMAYISQVGRLISEKVESLYRKKAKRRQIQGRTVVRVMIGVDGGVAAADVAESARYRTLDQIAIEAVMEASPFPRPPKGPITIFVPINFRLI